MLFGATRKNDKIINNSNTTNLDGIFIYPSMKS
jgi:hypothetical protein